MKNSLLLLLQLTALFPVFDLEDPRHSPVAPDGWYFWAFEPADYWYGVDTVTFHGGKRSGLLEYAVEPMVVHPRRGPAHFFAAFDAQAFRNRRVKITAYIRGRGLESGAFAWCHLEQRNRQMAYPISSEPIVGTTDWLKQTAVIDIAGTVDIIAIGVSLEGRGVLWLDDVQVETVEKSTPTTKEGAGLSQRVSLLGVRSIPDGPHNLDFEK
jgi:erythromycin esterase